MSFKEEIKCPKCLKGNDIELLESNTEYQCWSGEQVSVTCLNCDQHFEVNCEHQGYQPCYDSFDMNAFIKVHHIKIENDLSDIWVRHYLRDLIDDGHTDLVIPKPPYESQAKACTMAHKFAIKEWNRIQASIDGVEDETA